MAGKARGLIRNMFQATGIGSKLKLDSYVYSTAVVASRLPALLFLPLYARSLSPGDMGRLVTAWIFLDLLIALSGMGMKQALGRFFPLAASERDRKGVLSTAVAASIIGGTGIGLLFMVFHSLSGFRSAVEFLRQVEWELFLRLLIIGWFANLGGTLLMYFQAQRKAGSYLAAVSVGVFLEFALVGNMVLSGSLGLPGILTIEGIKYAGICIFILFACRRDLAWIFDWNTLKPMFQYGIWLVPVNLLDWALFSMDRFLLGQMAGLAAVGIYGFFYKFITPLNIFFSGYIRSLDTSLFYKKGEDGSDLIRDSLHSYLIRAGLISVACAILLPLGFHILIAKYQLFPEAYLPGIKIIPLLLAVVYLFYISSHFESILEYRFQSKKRLLLSGLSALFNLGMTLSLLWLASTQGWDPMVCVAFATLLAYCLVLGLQRSIISFEPHSSSIWIGMAFLGLLGAIFLSLVLLAG